MVAKNTKDKTELPRWSPLSTPERPLLHEEVLAMITGGTKEERLTALRNAGIITKSGKLSARYKK